MERSPTCAPLALFDGLDRRAAGELLAAGRGGPVRRRRGAVPRGRAGRLLVGAARRARSSLVRHVGREETVLGAMDVPGRWAGGFRAWDEHGVYLATGRGAAAGPGLRGVRRPRCASWSQRVVPVRRPPHRGPVPRRSRSIETVARQREALVALGTLAAGLAHEINNPAAAATRAVDALGDACETLLSVPRAAGRGPISADAVRRARRAAPRDRAAADDADPLAVADREEALSDWLAAHGVERDWLIAPPLARPGVDVAWCERVAEVLGDGDARAGAGVGGEHAVHDRRCSPR